MLVLGLLALWLKSMALALALGFKPLALVLALKVVLGLGLGLGLDSVARCYHAVHPCPLRTFWVFTVWHSSLSIVINSNNISIYS